MKHLSQLTPAEVVLLTKPGATHNELLKLTFIDLLFKQVLKTYEVERRPHYRDKLKVYTYVSIGKNFETYTSLNHERVFLSSFVSDTSIEILFSNLVKIAYQKSKALLYYKADIYKTPTLQKCFSQNIFQKLLYKYSITDYGAKLKKEVKEEIQIEANKLANNSTLESQMVIDLIEKIGGNIFLLVAFDHELFSRIDHEMGSIINRVNDNSGVGESGCAYMSFDDYSSSFDSSCSGDSGCSGGGCSGCGGD
ncbi:hypothetical protein WFZ85_13010 [Flavobacterium sp. j3]|uniref:Uncharacterized protein n=1 Tax=Flavobacterium aureirubrum TaxID=3133147 RepID=A0ABU9N765_9FLAO